MQNYFKRNKKATPVDIQIDAVLHEMQTIGVTDENYPTMMTYLERLNDVNAKKRDAPVSRDTIAIVVGNLLGILVIVAYEQKHVMTSKGFSLLTRQK